MQIAEEQRPLRVADTPARVLIHLGIDMAVDDEQILPSVVIVIEKAIAEADKWDGGRGDAGLIAHIA